jgi:hypothetical protein
VNKNDSVKLGDIYGNILRKVKTKPFMESKEQDLPKEGKGGKKTMPLAKQGGPEDVDDIEEINIDASKISKKENTNKDNLGGDTEKINKEAINKVMSKSIFDKLYLEMMGGSMGPESEELSELGIDAGGEGDDLDLGMGDDEGAGDEVTITMPRDVAKQLCDLLSAVVAEEPVEDELGGEGDEFGGEEGEGDDFSFDEDEEGEVKGHAGKGKVPFTGKGENKVGGDLGKTAGGSADGKYTVGDGKPSEHGHPMKGAKVPGELTGKSNKVSASKVNNPGANLFGN